MKTKMTNVLIALQAAAGVLMIGAVKIWAPVCGKMLELVSGKEVPMKCHWAGQAAIVVGILITAVWGKGIAAVTLATSLALLLGGKEGQIPD